MKYRIWCDFLVVADHLWDVEMYLAGMGQDLIENHIIIDQDPDSADEPYEDLTDGA